MKKFTTINLYESEKDFLEALLDGNKILCKHTFERDCIDPEKVNTFIAFLDYDFLMIVA